MRYRLTRQKVPRGIALARRRRSIGGDGIIRSSTKMSGAASMTTTAAATHPASVTMAGAASATFSGAALRVVLVKFTGNEMLDMIRTPRRVESFRYDVLDRAGNMLGRLAVTNQSVPSITNDSSRRIRRDLGGVTIPPRTAQTDHLTSQFFSDDIDTQHHRIKVWHVLGDGGPGSEFPMGLFVFSTDPRRVRSYGRTISASLDDLSQIFDHRAVESLTFASGTNVGDALAQLYALVGLEAKIEATSVTLGEPLTMMALQDSPQSTAEALCTLAGFLPPYFDNDGVGRCRATPEYLSQSPALVYGTGSRAYDSDIVESSTLLVSPNVWIAEAKSGTDDPIVGRYALPADDSHSYESIGYWIPEVVDVQGIDTKNAADEAARAAAMQSRRRLRHRHWSSPIDSRHDTFDSIQWDNDIDLEQSWSAELAPNGRMSHESVVLSP